METKADRFTGSTSYATPFDPRKAIRLLYPQLVVSFDSARPDTALLEIYEVSEHGWKYLECHEIHFLVDEKPFPVPAARHNGEPLHGATVLERVYSPIKLVDLGRLATGQKVEFKVCNDEFQLNTDDICNARALYWAAVDLLAKSAGAATPPAPAPLPPS